MDDKDAEKNDCMFSEIAWTNTQRFNKKIPIRTDEYPLHDIHLISDVIHLELYLYLYM